MSSNRSKFRPYFTTAQLAEIIRCVKASSKDLSLIYYLESFALKLKHSIIQPAHTSQPPLEEKLGFSSPVSAINQSIPPSELYATFLISPQSLTPPELEKVHQYRFENDLMDQDEEGEYLKSKGLFTL